VDFLGKRNDYGQQALTEAELVADPIRQFSLWLTEAEQAGIFEPNAFVLGTANAEGAPTARSVLLRGVDDDGFYFYTNYSSRKGHDIAQNQLVSMVFGWYPQFRQMLVEGYAEKVLAGESDAYFNTRPRDSQISAWASNQSQPIGSREALEAQYEERREQFATGDIPRPEFWGGYRIVPTRIEFWKGRSNRLHDRIEYARTGAGEPWTVRRLQP
jgi:pyridoxamine 5'-phosphate oxidase